MATEIHAPSPSPNLHSRNDDGYELAKIGACLLMIVNHCTFHLGTAAMLLGFIVSRAAMPTFAFILVDRLMADREARAFRLGRNLLLWGLFSQIFYGYFNRQAGFSTNILIDFLAGVWLISVNARYGFKSKMPLIIPALAATAMLNPYFGYTAALPIGMLLAANFVKRSKPLAMAIILVAGALGNNVYMMRREVAVAVVASSFLTVPLIAFSRELKKYSPRLPKMFFYAYYPFTYAVAIVIDRLRA